MRILVVTGIFEPESGGPATYLKHFLPELVERGHLVTVVTFSDLAIPPQPFQVIAIPRQGYLRRQWDYYRAAARAWPRHDLAYIQGMGLPMPPSIWPRIAKVVGDQAWERAMNRGWAPRDTDIDRFQTEYYNPQTAINKALRANYARDCEHIIVPSAYLKHMVANWGVDPQRISVVYNALPREMLDPGVEAAEARQQLGLPEGPLLFTASRLTAWKGIDHSLEVLAEMPDLHLVVAGDGPDLEHLMALRARLGLEARVHFVGRIGRDRLPLYYRAADYTVLYSGYEGLPHVLLESLYLGTPVIASDKGGNPEVLRHGVNGLLVPYVDRAELKSAFELAFHNGQRARLAANARLDLERFQWPTLVEQTIEVLKSFA